MRLAAQHADHWNIWANAFGNRPDRSSRCSRIWTSIAGKSIAIRELDRSASVLVDFDDPYGRPGQAVPSLTGTRPELADTYLRYAEAGVDHSVVPGPVHGRRHQTLCRGIGVCELGWLRVPRRT